MTTRSSQLYASRLLRLGSPLFHFGILLVILGHVGGILIPESWTDAVGISETASHAAAVVLGAISGAMTLAGAAILVYRRRTNGPVCSATTRNDKAMYVSPALGTAVLGNLIGYLTRPYIVYRSKPDTGTRAARRGWEPVGSPGHRDRSAD